MAKAGFNIQVSSRSYIPYVDDDELEIRLIRAQEISRYVEHGYLTAASRAMTGSSRTAPRSTRWAIFVQQGFAPAGPAGVVLPEDSPVKSVKDLEGKRNRHRGRQPDEKVSEEKRRVGRGGISWGRDRDEGARTGGRDRRVTETGSSCARTNCGLWMNC